MTTMTIQAIYVGGVFKPTAKPNLQDGEAVELQIVRPATEASRWQRRAAALARAGNLRLASINVAAAGLLSWIFPVGGQYISIESGGTLDVNVTHDMELGPAASLTLYVIGTDIDDPALFDPHDPMGVV